MLGIANEPAAFFWLIFAIIAIFPMIIFFTAFRRIGSKKMLITAMAFVVMFVKGVFLSLEVLFPGYDNDFWELMAAVLDIVAIILIVMALARQK